MPSSVFVSSTFVDLKDHRTEVRDIIRKLGAIDIAMEHLGARDDRPLKQCLDLVRDDSDLFVGIYAHRYGQMADHDISITEAEYNAASEAGLQRFIFLIDEDTHWLPKFIDSGKSAVRLNKFKKRLRANHVCDFFGDRKDLAAKVATFLGRHFGLGQLRRVAAPSLVQAKAVRIPNTKSAWSKHRDGIYQENRGVFIAHTLKPSKRQGQRYDIFIYLLRHKSSDFSDVVGAEFFQGKFWGNRIFKVKNEGGLIGISTSAYDTFLCTCRVQFSDGRQVHLSRYIDFEAPKPA